MLEGDIFKEFQGQYSEYKAGSGTIIAHFMKWGILGGVMYVIVDTEQENFTLQIKTFLCALYFPTNTSFSV